MAVPRVAGVGDLPGGDLQRGEQGGGAVPDVVVGGLLRQARAASAGSARSGPAPGSGTSRRSTAPPPSPAGPGTARPRRGPWPPARVGGELERLAPPRLQPPLAPDPGDPHVRDAHPGCDRPAAALDQCVTPSVSGGGSSVASTTATSSTSAGRPGFGRSSRPAIPRRRTASSTRSPSAWTPRPAPRSRSCPPLRPATRSAPAAPTRPATTDDRVHRTNSARSSAASPQPQSTTYTMLPRGKATSFTRH